MDVKIPQLNSSTVATVIIYTVCTEHV